MRILVCCNPRSRSELLISSISAKYGIKYEGPILFNRLQSALAQKEITEYQYLQGINYLVYKSKGISKLYSRYFKYFPSESLCTYFKNIPFSGFDQIFLTYRKNHTNRLCSLYILLEYTNRGINPINCTSGISIPKDYFISLSNVLIKDTQTILSFKKFFKHNNINFTPLEYNSIPLYLKKNNMPLNVKTPDINISIDYPSIISNYNEVDSYVKNNLNLSVSQ